MTNYAAMAKRIRECKTHVDFDRVSQSMDRIFEAGVFTTNEFMRLDGLMVDRKIELEAK